MDIPGEFSGLKWDRQTTLQLPLPIILLIAWNNSKVRQLDAIISLWNAYLLVTCSVISVKGHNTYYNSIIQLKNIMTTVHVCYSGCHNCSWILYNRCITAGCPTLLQTDAGSENSTMAALQVMFGDKDNDNLAGVRSHRYSKSTSNQVNAWYRGSF